ncbi:ABA4-like family protein [Crocosphaera sp. UHCC 0190]|uniref:ABA4-like family protein n=1 Tax=Crocosphaera sp. UHCC 0190 TaxID=3110246 RepID=UPI002B1FC023|nr:ABA4-like family protein [Crocosphaera sp. UHCC 0190]MEA5508482.1 ABA4-like family protein [Crocosphaera sp. UHCC 0190]
MFDLSLLFNLANVYVLPFWLLMVILPKWGITQKVMTSYLPFVPLAGLYIYLFSGSLDPESAAAFSNPTLPILAQLFSQEPVMLTGWVHFIVLDLFTGRYIYLDGKTKGIWTIHSLIFCLLAGPIGLLSHILTSWIQLKFFKNEDVQVSATS